jgi:hypothetical protein
MGDEERRYEVTLIEGYAWIAVRQKRHSERGFDWAATLVVVLEGRPRAICSYDNAHGAPERHRFRRGVKMTAEAVSPRGDAGLDIPAAIDEIKAEWEGMVERWEP